MRIITLTLNPAFDLHCYARSLSLHRENFVKAAEPEAAGKGINLSRALLLNGIESEAVVVVGEENGKEYLDALKRGGLSVCPIFAKGKIRENITVHEENAPETRISFGGFSADKAVLEEIKAKIGKADENTVIALTGSFCDGIKAADITSLLGLFKNAGVRIIVDSRSVSFDDIISFKPWLIKPNGQEIEGYIKRPINGIEDAVVAARELWKSGVQNVMITLGGEGAVLANEEGVFKASAPKISALSTIGAGDSTIAGFVKATVLGLSSADALRMAVSFGTAACLREGTLPPTPEQVEKIMQKVTVQRI